MDEIYENVLHQILGFGIIALSELARPQPDLIETREKYLLVLVRLLPALREDFQEILSP